MRIRRLTIHRGCHVEALATSGDAKRHAAVASTASARQQTLLQALVRCVMRGIQWRTTHLLIAVIVWGVLWHGCSGAALSPDLTFSEWAQLFDSASSSLQLPQLYQSGPRVRAKILAAKSITMDELFNGEMIFRHRISEIVDVAPERVSLEYLETTALQETARGSWAVTLGISALAPPPPDPNHSSISTSVDAERGRIFSRLRYGGIVDGANVTVASLQLFGTPMQLTSVALEGESFYQIDSRPWVGVSLGLRTYSTPTAVSVAESSSSGAAFQNLRLRFVLSRFLPNLQVDTSSILVRDTLTPDVTSEFGSDVAVIVVPIEIHVGDDPLVRDAVDGYLRNTSLSAAIQEIEPHWMLFAVDVDEWMNTDSGDGSNATNGTTVTEQTKFDIKLLVTGFAFDTVRNRAFAILDATRSYLSNVLESDSVEVSFGRIEIVRSSEQIYEREVAAFPASGGGDMDSSRTLPINCDFLLSITVAPAVGGGVSLTQVHKSIEQMVSTTDIRLGLGFLDFPELSFPSHRSSEVKYIETINTTHNGEVTSDNSFVVIVLVVKGRDATVLDNFGLYAIRCALLDVLESVLVHDDDLVVLNVIPQEDTYMRVLFRINLQDQAQRLGILAGVRSQRFSRYHDTKTEMRLVEHLVDVEADRSSTKHASFPGAEFNVQLDSDRTPSYNQMGFLESAEIGYHFADPIPTQNPSVLESSIIGCPSLSSINSSRPFFSGCLVIRWSNQLPARSVFLRSLYVTRGVTVTSPNIALPAARDSNVFPAPWLPDTLNGAEPLEWAIHLLSYNSSNVSVRLVLAFATPNSSFAAFQLAANISLADARLSTSEMYLTSLRRLQVTVAPPPFAVDPPKKLLSTLVTGSISEHVSPRTVNVTIGLAQRSALGLFSPQEVSDRWRTSQPECQGCLTLIEHCSQLEECNQITQCFRSVVDDRITMVSEAIEVSEPFDLSHVLGSCLTSSPSNGWSSRGRSAFTSVLRCVLQSACTISSRLRPKLTLQYTPRFQTIRLVDAHFPLSLNFLLDINGGVGNSVDGQTKTQTYSNISSITSETLAALRAVVLSLYGNMTRGMDVETSYTADVASGLTIVRIEYSFLDITVTGLPSISVLPHEDEPAPIVESAWTDSLITWLRS